MTASEIKSHVFSAALASSVLFGYGYHSTIDAIIVTAVWIFISFLVLAVGMITFFTIAIRRHEDRDKKELGAFYKSIADMHKNPLKRVLGFIFVGYWLYAFIIQEWTVTAVIYVIITAYMQLFIFLTKDIAKEFFVNQLKGEGITE